MANFFDVCKEIQGHTLVTPDRLWNLWSWVNDTVQSVGGNIAELGSYKGGSAKLLAKAVGQSRAIHVFDSFDGVPKSLTNPDIDFVMEDHPHLNVHWEGSYHGGEWASSYNDVVNFLKDCPAIRFHPGLVPDTLTQVESESFCFVYLDMDIYAPTVAALDFFWDRLNNNGVIMIDDYHHLQGVTDAVDEFVVRKNTKVINTCFMQCAIRKEGS